VSRTTSAGNWWHTRSLGHLLVLVTFLLRSFRMVLERSNLGSNQINVGHCTRSCSASTEPFRVEPVGIEVSVEVCVKLIFLLASSEDEEHDHDDGKKTEGTSDNTAGDGRGIRRRSATRCLGLGGDDELGGPHCLGFDLAILIGGPRNHVEKKRLAIVPDREIREGVYKMTVLKTTVEVDKTGPEVVEGGTPCVEVVDGVGAPGVTEVEVEVGVTTGGCVVELVVEGGTSGVVEETGVVVGGSVVEGGWVAVGRRCQQ